jgi:hypothetical protein
MPRAASFLIEFADASPKQFTRWLTKQIDQIVVQAKEEGSLKVAISGLNSIRQTLDSMSRLAGHDRADTNINVAVLSNVRLDVAALAERLEAALFVINGFNRNFSARKKSFRRDRFNSAARKSICDQCLISCLPTIVDGAVRPQARGARSK